MTTLPQQPTPRPMLPTTLTPLKPPPPPKPLRKKIELNKTNPLTPTLMMPPLRPPPPPMPQRKTVVLNKN